MKSAISRFNRLATAYARLLTSTERDIASCLVQRNHLQDERAAIAAALAHEGPLLDLAVPAAVHRMAAIDRDSIEADLVLAALRGRALVNALRSKHAAKIAAKLADQQQKRTARDELAELAGRISTPQACGK